MLRPYLKVFALPLLFILAEVFREALRRLPSPPLYDRATGEIVHVIDTVPSGGFLIVALVAFFLLAILEEIGPKFGATAVLSFNENEESHLAHSTNLRWLFWESYEDGGIKITLVFIIFQGSLVVSNCRARVREGGPLCEVLAVSRAGAIVRVTGDMRNRTLEVMFRQRSIPFEPQRLDTDRA
jgi:hypothetical protein